MSVKFLVVAICVCLAFALGNRLGQKAPQQTSSPIAKSERRADARDRLKEAWRARFLALLSEPSGSRRTAGFYAMAIHAKSDELPIILEAIHPEGWSRQNGDLPLALAMEWTRRDPASMSGWLHAFATRYPELQDNLEQVFVNLGIQGDMRATETLAAMPRDHIREGLERSFLEELKDYHPDLLFSARIALYPAPRVFYSLSVVEFDQAVDYFWTNASELQGELLYPRNNVCYELGRRYGIECLDRLPTLARNSYLLSGIASRPDTDMQRLITSAEGYWACDFDDRISADDARRIIEGFASSPILRAAMRAQRDNRLWKLAQDESLIDEMIRRHRDDQPFLAFVLQMAGNSYPIGKLAPLLDELPDFARERSLVGSAKFATCEEALAWLQAVPEEWLSPDVQASFLRNLPEGNSLPLLQILALKVGGMENLLTTDSNAGRKLLEISPSLYVDTIASLDPANRLDYMQRFLMETSPDEADAILEAVSSDDRQKLLIQLADTRPDYALPVLSAMGLSALSNTEATQLGNSLGLAADSPELKSFLESLKMDTVSEKIAFFASLQYAEDDPDEPVNAYTKPSPGREYVRRLYDATQALILQNDLSGLEAVKRDDDGSFLPLILASNTWDDGWREGAKRLLQASFLTADEKQTLYRTIYDPTAP